MACGYGVTIIAGAVALAILAGALYLLLASERRRAASSRPALQVLDVTPQLVAPRPAALPDGRRGAMAPATGRRVKVGERREG